MEDQLHTAYFSESEIIEDFNREDFEGARIKLACAIRQELKFGDDDTLVERFACLLGTIEMIAKRGIFRKVKNIDEILTIG